jgi:tryptophan synthase beta chain
MHTLGHTFVPAGIHAGGLRYHGMSPIVSQLYNDGLIEARAYLQLDVFDAAVRFARSEAIIPAPEAAHAIKAAIDEALRCKEEGKQQTILFNLSGHGNFDMAAYDAYFAGQLEDITLPQEEIQRALRDIEGLPMPATT